MSDPRYPDRFERRRYLSDDDVAHYRTRARSRPDGFRRVAAQLKKQGRSLTYALLVLGIKPTYGLPPRGGGVPASTSQTPSLPTSPPG